MGAPFIAPPTDTDAALGGLDARHEAPVKADPQLAGEAMFAHVGQGLLLGSGLTGSTQGPGIVQMGRNLLVQGEHAAAARSARELLDQAPAADQGDTAHAFSGAPDPGTSYLRDNADQLTSKIATRHAKAAQTLLDSYGEISKLKPSPKQLEDSIPDNSLDQSRWIAHAASAVDATLSKLPSSIGGPLLKQAAALGDSPNAADWFSRASDLSDAVMTARIAAAKRDNVPSEARTLAAQQASNGSQESSSNGHPLEHIDALDHAQSILRDGLTDPKLWGGAAVQEERRHASYEARVGEHLDDFTHAFTSQIGGQRRADPGKFAAFLQNDEPGVAGQAFSATLDGARATADTARQFGRGADAQRILGAVGDLELGQRHAKAIRAAVRGGPGNDPESVATDALAALGGGADTGAQSYLRSAAARGGAFRAVSGFMASTAAATRDGVRQLLSPAPEGESQGGADLLGLAATTTQPVSLLTFDATRDHIEKMANDPRYFGEVLGSSFGALPEHSPELYSAISQQTAKAVNYLLATAPGGKSGGPFGRRFPVAEDELYEWNQRVNAVTDPEFVKASLAQGTLSAPASEALQAVNQRHFEQLQVDVFDRLRQLQQQGVPVPTQAREQIETLLGIDGGGEPGLTWQVAERAQAAQAAHAQQMAKTPPQGVKLPSAQSSALATLGNGATAQG